MGVPQTPIPVEKRVTFMTSIGQKNQPKPERDLVLFKVSLSHAYSYIFDY